MTAITNLRYLLAERPEGRAVREADFHLDRAPMPEPGDGQVLLRTLFLSLDPYMRGRMSAARSYAPPVEIGAVMTGEAVAEVVASRATGFAAGDIVLAYAGWQQYAALPAKACEKIDRARLGDLPLSYLLGVLGMPGATAFFALDTIGKPKAGETVLISAAAGAVGQVAGQIAKRAGCKVIATAGAADKLDYVTHELGFDVGIDYKGKDAAALATEIGRHAPHGIDVFFDNVGGVMHDAVMTNLALNARIIICGAIAAYDRLGQSQPGGADTGPRWNRQLLVKRALMQGFLVSDHRARWGEFRTAMTEWLTSGRIRYREDIVEGIEAAPRAFIGLLGGANRGKLLVRGAG
ncbi:MAG TPA: NADP-dependent oxidoreductase [Stellaceae bacterium]|nr:NADP-dependent oxidoreductase [Stellaceae bacterium]